MSDDEILEKRRQIDQTKSDLQETIEAIRHKLEPERLKNQAQDAVRDATIGRAERTMNKAMDKAEDAMRDMGDTAMDARSGIMDTIRQNPLPAALAGIGLGWLFMNRSGRGQHHPRYYGGDRGFYGGQGSYYSGRTFAPTYAPQYRTTGSTFTGGTHSIEEFREDQGLGDKMDQARETAGEKLDETREAAGEMMDQVRRRTGDMMGNAGDMATQTGSNMFDVIRENPLPAAIAGFSLGWLFLNSSSKSEPPYPYSYDVRSPMGRGESYFNENQGPIDKAKDTVGGAVGQVQDTAGDIADRAQETVGNVTDQMQETFGSMADQTRYHYSRVEDRVQESLNSNPLVVGAVAAAVGAGLAMLMPTTHQERRFMGEARDNLMDKAQSTAQQTMDKVQRVADEVQNTAKDKARDEGLTQ